MDTKIERNFILLGLLQLLIGMLSPLLSPVATAMLGLVYAHVIGTLQALLYFSFAWIWPKLALPKPSNFISLLSFHLALWSNLIGTIFSGLLGSGKAQYILKTSIDQVPGDTGIGETITLILLNMSLYILLPILLGIVGIVIRKRGTTSRPIINTITSLFFCIITILVVVLTMNPSFSNG